MKRFPTQCYVAPAQSRNVTTSAARSGRGKRRCTDSLPALETVFQQCSSTKSQAMESFSRLAQVDFQHFAESAKICCIFARFSVMKVAHRVLSIPVYRDTCWSVPQGCPVYCRLHREAVSLVPYRCQGGCF